MPLFLPYVATTPPTPRLRSSPSPSCCVCLLSPSASNLESCRVFVCLSRRLKVSETARGWAINAKQSTDKVRFVIRSNPVSKPFSQISPYLRGRARHYYHIAPRRYNLSHATLSSMSKALQGAPRGPCCEQVIKHAVLARVSWQHRHGK